MSFICLAPNTEIASPNDDGKLMLKTGRELDRERKKGI
jgi:hypothetical protein